MADTFPPVAQRSRLLEFRQAIGAREASLRRVDCGDWAVSGTSGHVYAVPEGFQLYVSTGERPRRWTAIKSRLAFCRITQDGDDEGSFILNRLPTTAEGAIIREALGIPKARHLSEEQRSSLIAAGAHSRFRDQKTAKSDAAGTKVAAARFQGKESLIIGASSAHGQSTVRACDAGLEAGGLPSAFLALDGGRS